VSGFSRQNIPATPSPSTIVASLRTTTSSMSSSPLSYWLPNASGSQCAMLPLNAQTLHRPHLREAGTRARPRRPSPSACRTHLPTGGRRVLTRPKTVLDRRSGQGRRLSMPSGRREASLGSQLRAWCRAHLDTACMMSSHRTCPTSGSAAYNGTTVGTWACRPVAVIRAAITVSSWRLR
jgi:hypothetical protein